MSFADEYTHQLGNSGYAVREAMQQKANTKSPELYWKAVKLQREARLAFQSENLEKAMELSREAEKLAKQALKEATQGEFRRDT